MIENIITCIVCVRDRARAGACLRARDHVRVRFSASGRAKSEQKRRRKLMSRLFGAGDNSAPGPDAGEN